MKTCRCIFVVIGFILSVSFLAYPFVPKDYISSSDLQNDICNLAIRMKFFDTADNDGYYIYDNSKPDFQEIIAPTSVC